MLFRQAKREGAQTLEEFYTHLLGLAAKTFPEETADTIDRMITDQFIVRCEIDRTRLHLIEKGPCASMEVLALGIAHQAAIRYNESLKDAHAVAAVGYRSPVTTTITQQFRGRGNNYFLGQNRGNSWNSNYDQQGSFTSRKFQQQNFQRQNYHLYRPLIYNNQQNNNDPNNLTGAVVVQVVVQTMAQVEVNGMVEIGKELRRDNQVNKRILQMQSIARRVLIM